MASAARWWREWEFWAVLLLAGLIYFPRLGTAELSGEEHCRGQVAREMIVGGDWIVPRAQGLPLLSRPPVQNWAIAAFALARGDVDALSIRLPSALALLLTTALIYAYGRTFLSRVGALWAAAAYPTMGLVLQFGWLGETESLYTFIVAGSLIVWRWADRSSEQGAGSKDSDSPLHAPRSMLLAWCGGYGLAAVGMLTKGPQAPVYFVAGVGLFLVLTRRWRELFRWQHAAGIAVFLAIWLAWEVPFCLRVTPHEAWLMLTGDTAGRFEDTSLLKIGKHMIEFPLSVAACVLPWGVLLLAYFRRDFRRRPCCAGAPDFARGEVCFLAVSIGFEFLTCYVAPGARNRYLAPMLPLVALLIGLAAQQCSAAAAGALRRLWRDYFIFAGVLCAGLGVWFALATVLRLGAFRGQQPPAFALAFTLAAAAATAIAFACSRATAVRERLGVLTLAAFLGLTYSGAIMNVFVATWHPIGDEVAAATTEIPQGAELVSIGTVNRVFLYYYGRPIRPLPADAGVGGGPRTWTWFCMNGGEDMPRVDTPYEKLATISMETAYTDHPRHTVIIGRRLNDATAEQSFGRAGRPM